MQPATPSKIKELIQNKEDELRTIGASLSGAIGPMISDYNLTSGQTKCAVF